MNSATQDHHSALARAGQAIHARGWAPATSGIDKNDLDGLIRQLLEI